MEGGGRKRKSWCREGKEHSRKGGAIDPCEAGTPKAMKNLVKIAQSRAITLTMTKMERNKERTSNEGAMCQTKSLENFVNQIIVRITEHFIIICQLSHFSSAALYNLIHPYKNVFNSLNMSFYVLNNV